MKIIRYQDKEGAIGCAAQQADGSALKLIGNIYDSPKVTTDHVSVTKLLAPIQPSSIICIGLNYRKHAEETGAKFPEFPGHVFQRHQHPATSRRTDSAPDAFEKQRGGL